jgi:tetratricopeptide (TPR) repeat protein
MKKLLFAILSLAVIQTAVAQTMPLDSLMLKLRTEKNAENRIDLANIFLSNTAEVDPVLDLQNSQKILQFAQSNKDKVIEALTLSNIGYDYRAFGNTATSLMYNLKAVALSIETDNEKLLANTQLNLAHNYKDQAEYAKAIDLYMAAASHAIKSKDNLVQCWIFSSLAQVYQQKNKLDSALMYAQKSYELCLQIHNIDFLPATLLRLGSIQGKMKNELLAVSYLQMAIQTAYKIHAIRYISDAYSALAKYYFDDGKNDSASLYSRKAIAVVQNTSFSNKSIEPAKLLLDIYENTNSDSAIKYFKIYKAANDSVFSAKTIQQTQLMTFDEDLRQQQLAQEKIRAEEQRHQNIQFALIAFGIISFIIIFLLFSRSIVANEKLISFFGILGLLIVFEFVNLLLHPWLASFTHESPVLMLLALVAIASLLIPFHHKMEHWIKEKMVEKNKAIRLAAAKKTIEKLSDNTNQKI